MQSGRVIDDVDLPPWAQSPDDFVRLHRNGDARPRAQVRERHAPRAVRPSRRCPLQTLRLGLP